MESQGVETQRTSRFNVTADIYACSSIFSPRGTREHTVRGSNYAPIRAELSSQFYVNLRKITKIMLSLSDYAAKKCASIIEKSLLFVDSSQLY